VTFCDHGTWVGPCSQEKHKAVSTGMNPWRVGIDPKSKEVVDIIGMVFEHFKWAFSATVRDGEEGNELRCRCCKHLYSVFSMAS
jgi:hypothetical protein